MKKTKPPKPIKAWGYFMNGKLYTWRTPEGHELAYIVLTKPRFPGGDVRRLEIREVPK
jgi:hypothetical protein